MERCPPPSHKNRTPERNVWVRPSRLHRGHGKYPLSPFAPPSARLTRQQAARIESAVSSPPLSPACLFCSPLRVQQLPLSSSAPTRTRAQHANEPQGPSAPFALGCGRYAPTSPPFVLSALTPPLVAAPPRLCTRPLPFSPPVCHVHRGLLPIPRAPEEGERCQTVSHAHPPSSCATPPCVPPQPTSFAHVPPDLVCGCGIRHALRAGGKRLRKPRWVGGDRIHPYRSGSKSSHGGPTVSLSRLIPCLFLQQLSQYVFSVYHSCGVGG